MKNFTLTLFMLFSFLGISQTWNQIPVPTNKKLNDIDFPTSNVGYIVGDDSLIMKSIDGGHTWNVLPISTIVFVSTNDIVQVNFITEDIGYVNCVYSGTWRTLDGGQTWGLVPVAADLDFSYSTYIFDTSNVLVGGMGMFQGGLIDRYSNGSSSEMNLNYVPLNSGEAVKDIDFRDANNGLAALYSQYILKSVDGGNNWDTIPTPLDPDQYFTSVLWYNDTLAYAGYVAEGSGSGVLVSEDAGLTWGYSNGFFTFAYPDMSSIIKTGNGTVHVGGSPFWNESGSINTKDTTMNTWSYENVDHRINGLASYGDDVSFAVGDSGYLIVNQDWTFSGVTSLGKEENGIIYPNPASNTISLECDNCKLSDEKVILNAQGQEVLEVSGIKEIDVSSLAPGIYYLRFAETGSTLKFVKD